ncbi:hypothetical protein J2X66_005552 [Pseudomonas sp. 3296]|uniref:hypothetical protein n=1 Tax=Pseudomonas sp. 3296 TaxID=2817753 RepID=UPI00285F2A71|nr:hypothetical protein [Pseudomonas sp. 3296]MDR6918649.1 hypothetical protein [Pseudomonas sp. 3296]
MRYLYLPAVAMLGLLAACDAGKPKDIAVNSYCSLDSPKAEAKLSTSAPFEVWGWAYNVAAGTVPKDISLEIISSGGEVAMTAPLVRSSRPDVAKAFAKPDLEMAGFTGVVDIGALKSGVYTVKIIQQEGISRFACTSPSKFDIKSTKG